MKGLPPFGLGAYIRDRQIDGPFRFRLYHYDGGRASAGREISGGLFELRETTPTRWRRVLDLMYERAIVSGANMILVNPEQDWQGVGRSEARAFGARCREIAGSVRVGITSFPTWPGLAGFAEGAGDAVFGSPQIYGFSSENPAVWQQWADRWSDAFGGRLAPTISMGGTVATLDDTPEGYAYYLANLPKAPGAIAFPAAGGVPQWRLNMLADWNPGGNAIAQGLMWAGLAAKSPQGLVLLSIVLAIAVGVALVGVI